jgi:hypothetical protein
MVEKIATSPGLTTNFGCGFKGYGGRPDDCKNDPEQYPENHRPKVCYECVVNFKMPAVAEIDLPKVYILFKQKVGI